MSRVEHRNDANGSELDALDQLRLDLARGEENREASLAGLASALETVTGALSRHWSTGGGTALRQFVWSLWNGEHYVNLYDLSAKLDSPLSRAVGVVFNAHLSDGLSEDDLRNVLLQSGEFVRWERESDLTPKGEIVLYPPLPFSVAELRQLANSAKQRQENRHSVKP